MPLLARISGFYLLGAFSLIMGMSSLSSCESFWRGKPDKLPLARVGEKYLFKEDVAPLIDASMSPGDSAAFVSSLINSWAIQQLLLEKARINLSEAQIARYDSMVSDYREDLYTRAYKEALVGQHADTTVTAAELERFYEQEKENFRLQEKVVRLRFIELPIQFLNREEVTSRLRSFSPEDQVFLDSVGVQFRKLNFNDSLWVPAARVIEEIPPLTAENEDQYLNKSQFFELEDEQGVYLAEVVDVLPINEIAPLSYIEPTLRQVLMNRRKMRYLRALETDLVDEAIRQNQFQIYENPQ